MPHIDISELDIPPRLTPEFVAVAAVTNDVLAAAVGNHDIDTDPAELLQDWSNPYETKRMLVARNDDDAIVGWAGYEVQSGADVPSSWLQVWVRPEFSRRGIGTALHERVAAIAAAEGRTVLQAEAFHAPGGGAHIASPTGHGSVPADDPAARFLLQRGFRLAQVERVSRLELPLRVSARPQAAPGAPGFGGGERDSGAASAAAGYALEVWSGLSPAADLDDLALLRARMSTDPPLGDMDYQPEEWDAERVRERELRNASAGRLMLTAVVRHEASGRLVGFSDMAVPAQAHRPVIQEDTLVLGEHRGHRLGMALKVANLRQLAEVSPGHPSIYTWNAEENRHMLSVNEALGFVAVGCEGIWRR
jgi:GNAT superfamily N-acetyltransferase